VWTYTDLEVDVAKFEDGTVGLLDEDELDEVVATGLLGPGTASRVMATAHEVLQAITDSAEPFGKTGWRRLDALHNRSS
jgi:predicted RNA-binding protein associated with RNAse of E/G family